MKQVTLFIISIFIASSSMGQGQTTEDQVIEPIKRLFDGMKLGDSSMVHQAFYKEVDMYSVIYQEGSSKLHEGNLDNFLKAIGTPKEQQWEEKIWDIKVEIDEPLAQVWCQYAFYVDDQMHHCGVDAFQLILTEEGWKIFNIADTRNTENCQDPPQ